MKSLATGLHIISWYMLLHHVLYSRPLLLLLDGHSTHYNPSFIRQAAEEKVISEAAVIAA